MRLILAAAIAFATFAIPSVAFAACPPSPDWVAVGQGSCGAGHVQYRNIYNGNRVCC